MARLSVALSLARTHRRRLEIKAECHQLEGTIQAGKSMLLRLVGAGKKCWVPADGDALNRDERGCNPLTPGSELFITKMLSGFTREIIPKDIFCSVDICVQVINSNTGTEQEGKTLLAWLVTSITATDQATAFILVRSLMPP